MGTWVEQVHKRASVFQDQIVAARHAEIETGANLAGMLALLQRKLREIYEDEMPLAKIYDGSDIVFHAEGPSAAGSMPGLHAFNWLCSSAERQLRHLARSIFDLSDKDSKRLANRLDLRFSGFAPGSIYAGFSLADIPQILDSDEPEDVHAQLRFAIRQLPAIPEFIGDETLSGEINELIPDPAMRDASLEAVFKLSPSGRAGIHTIDISSPQEKNAALTSRERVVLREALKKPMQGIRRIGRFVGDVREIDLDSGRFHLRNIDTIGTLRCVLPQVSSEDGKQMLGNKVMVEGEYELDSSGRPRLLFANSISPVAMLSEQQHIDI